MQIGAHLYGVDCSQAFTTSCQSRAGGCCDVSDVGRHFGPHGLGGDVVDPPTHLLPQPRPVQPSSAQVSKMTLQVSAVQIYMQAADTVPPHPSRQAAASC